MTDISVGDWVITKDIPKGKVIDFIEFLDGMELSTPARVVYVDSFSCKVDANDFWYAFDMLQKV